MKNKGIVRQLSNLQTDVDKMLKYTVKITECHNQIFILSGVKNTLHLQELYQKEIKELQEKIDVIYDFYFSKELKITI